MSYVQGFLLAVPTEKKAEYIDIAGRAARIFKRHGAVSVVETWGVDVPDGKVTSFPMAVKLEENETVVFSWIVWEDKESAEKGKLASFKEMEAEFGTDMSSMPFDGMRMVFGDFETIVEA